MRHPTSPKDPLVIASIVPTAGACAVAAQGGARRPEGFPVADLLVLTSVPAEPVLPALELLGHRVRQVPAEAAQLLSGPDVDLVLIDGRTDLAGARALCRIVRAASSPMPLLLVLSEGGMSVVSADWEVDDVVLMTAGPAEADARIRLALSRRARVAPPARITASGLVIDDASYSAKIHGRPLDLTYKEFQLLHFLATHPARVFTREQLLSEVWGYDYFGGTRTVDVHVRRLRAKLGDADQVIGTVRNVGYRFNIAEEGAVADRSA